MIDRFSVDKAVKKFHDALTNRNTDAKDLPIRCRSRLELGNFPITFSSDEWLDFIELSLADWLLKENFLLNLTCITINSIALVTVSLLFAFSFLSYVCSITFEHNLVLK